MKTVDDFIPNTPAGEDAGRVMAADDGYGAVLTVHLVISIMTMQSHIERLSNKQRDWQRFEALKYLNQTLAMLWHTRANSTARKVIKASIKNYRKVNQ